MLQWGGVGYVRRERSGIEGEGEWQGGGDNGELQVDGGKGLGVLEDYRCLLWENIEDV